VRAAAQALPGVGEVDYQVEADLFYLEYEADRIELADIFGAIVLAGKKMGQEYRPRVVD